MLWSYSLTEQSLLQPQYYSNCMRTKSETHTSLHSPEHKYVCGFAYTTKPWYGDITEHEFQAVLKKTLCVSV